MKKPLQFPLRISTRSLLAFRIIAYIIGVACIGFISWSIYVSWEVDSWRSDLHIINWVFLGVVILFLLRKLKYYRNVIWNNDHLLVKDKHDIIIPLNEIREVELKTLNGVHEVHLLEDHPYLGESFFFLGSLNYFFRHKKVDLTIQALNERIAEAKREAA